MNTITEQAREIPVKKETDVVVIGGGISGIAAAVAARRCGAEVTLIERSVCLGGLATNGLVCVYFPLDDGAGNRIMGGLAQELLHTTIRYGFNDLPDCWKDGPLRVEDQPPGARYRTTFNIPAAVLAFDELVQNEGIDVMFDTAFCAPVMEGNTIKAVLVENKSGRTAFAAKVFIDASGDSDLLYRSGVPTETDPECICSSWTHEIDASAFAESFAKGGLKAAAPLRWFGLRPDVDNTNSVIPKFDATDADQRNAYIRLSRKLMLDYLKQNQRDDYCFMTYPTQIQTRMTRRIVGKKELNCVDAYAYEETSIGCVAHCMDVPAEVYEFPYEGLYSTAVTNVLAAGRMVSAGGRGWEIMRSIPQCALTGEAAGTAAALAAKGDGNVDHVDIRELQRILLANGNILHCTDAMKEKETHRNDYHKNAKASDGVMGIKFDSLSYDEGGH
ncbi:MAG: FAD-dependent oxidoreductase [Lachnospiraceae bacterium]|nr:FAD-dependent oxidoreductase [Lachnospiraceae bacterium]